MSNVPPSIGRYEILGSIGRGGMGSLFLALDPLLDRQLAIKLLRDDDDDLRERFAREARAAARLRHPNIVTIFDVGEHDGQPFIAMEYIQGQTLAEVVRSNVAMPIVRKLELIEALCDGLGFAHRSGIIHRDIKPANLMIDADGSLKILDFGIARASESASMTQAGMLIGTLNYMSPEQVSGQPVDLRSDLFAVGAVFYELVAYRQAFPGGLMAGILNKILTGQPEPLPSIVPDIDPDVVRIVERALEKDPKSRYPDLPEMRHDVAMVRMRLAASDPSRVIGTTPGPGDSGRFSPPSSSPSRRSSADLESLSRRRNEQIERHLAEGEAKLSAGDADAAMAAAEQALMLDANHAKAHGLIDRARAAIEARQVEEALEAASGGIASGDFAAATSHIDRAAEIDPKAPRIAEVRRSLDEAVQRQEEARQRELLEKRVREVIAESEGLFAKGRRDDAVSALAAFKPSHPIVAQALERTRAEVERLAGEERAAAEQAAAEAAERARREEEAHAARERAKATAEALRDAKHAAGPEAALAILRPALERDASNVDLQRAAKSAEADLKRAEERAAAEAKREAEKAAREQAAREKAERQQAERDKAEREATEKAGRERVEQQKADRAKAEREAAEKAARGKADREKADRERSAAITASADADADDRTVVIFKRDAPDQTIAMPAPPAAAPDERHARSAAPEMSAPASTPVAPPPSKPKPEPPPRPAKPAAAPPPPPSIEATPSKSSPQAAPGGVSNAVKYGGAAAAVLLVVVGFVVFGGGSSPEPVPADAGPAAPEVPGSTAAVESPGAGPEAAAGGPEPAPAGTTAAASAAPTNTNAAAPAAPAPAAATAAPAAGRATRPSAPSAQDQQLDSLFADAERLRTGGDLRTALERVEAGLKIRGNDQRFSSLAEDIRQDAERRMGAARSQAQSIGPPATSQAAFRQGDDLAGQARQHAGAGRDADAARAAMDAQARFESAATEGRRVAAADEQRRQTEAQAAQRARDEQAAAVNARANEEKAIRGVVEQYRLAYDNLDAAAVGRVFPSAPVAQLRSAWQRLERQSVTFSNVSVTLDAAGASATVTAATRTIAKPRGAGEQEVSAPITLTLRKNNNAWVITGRK